ncbi:MAG: hypothetical protein AAFX99_09960 [Myxococcota bacterium]
MGDQFTVNLGIDDASWIVDLGSGEFEDHALDPEGLVANDGEPSAQVTIGHLYMVYTHDSDSQQFNLFRVVGHELNRSVTLEWLPLPPGESPNAQMGCSL